MWDRNRPYASEQMHGHGEDIDWFWKIQIRNKRLMLVCSVTQNPNSYRLRFLTLNKLTYSLIMEDIHFASGQFLSSTAHIYSILMRG